jgi:hypothetical protein
VANGNEKNSDGKPVHRRTIPKTPDTCAGSLFPLPEPGGCSCAVILYAGGTCVKWIPPLSKFLRFGDMSDEISSFQKSKIITDLFSISYYYIGRAVGVKSKLDLQGHCHNPGLPYGATLQVHLGFFSLTTVLV